MIDSHVRLMTVMNGTISTLVFLNSQVIILGVTEYHIYVKSETQLICLFHPNLGTASSTGRLPAISGTSKELGQGLIRAAKAGNCSLLTRLVESGADLYAEDGSFYNYTFLHHLAENGEHKCIGQLRDVIPRRQLTILVNIKTTGEETALMKASYLGKVDTAKALINLRANLDLKDNEGRRTAFYWACRYGKLSLAKLLFEHGCQWKLNDDEGRSPLWTAAFHGHTDTAAGLLDFSRGGCGRAGERWIWTDGSCSPRRPTGGGQPGCSFERERTWIF